MGNGDSVGSERSTLFWYPPLNLFMKIKPKTQKVCSEPLDNSNPVCDWFIHLLLLMNIGWVTTMPSDGLNQKWMVNLHRTHSLKPPSPVGGWLGPSLGNVYCWDLAQMINAVRAGNEPRSFNKEDSLLVSPFSGLQYWHLGGIRKKRRWFFVATQYHLWTHWHEPMTPVIGSLPHETKSCKKYLFNTSLSRQAKHGDL